MKENKKLGKSKLFKLKQWLTVPEAARHLSTLFEEVVSEADVLQLALNRHLTLSVNFVNHASVRRGKVIPLEAAKWKESFFDQIVAQQVAKRLGDTPEGKEAMHCAAVIPPVLMMEGLPLDSKRVLELEDNVTSIEGVWDLPMIGGERLDVEHAYHQHTGGPAVTLTYLDGVFVEGNNGNMCQLQESYDENEFQLGSNASLKELKDIIEINRIGKAKAAELLTKHKQDREKYLEKKRSRNHSEDYYPAGGLPSDSVFVVRTSALLDLQERVSGNPLEVKQVNPKTEKSDLHVIGALVEIIIEGQLYSSEEKLRDHIAEQYRGYSGCASRTLAGRFAEAKKLLRLEE